MTAWLRGSLLIILTIIMSGCLSTTPPLNVTSGSPDSKAIHDQVLRAVCINLVPVAGSSRDTEETRRQIRRNNARVSQCPPEYRQRPDLN